MNPSVPPPLSWRERLLRPATVHQAVQTSFFIFFVIVGVQFTLFALWAMGLSELYVPKPASVAAFLPISGLMSFKRLVVAGVYDAIHPAALTILLMALVASLLFRKGFCGYLCPIGWLSLRLDRLGRRLGIRRQPGRVLSFLLSVPKYVIMASLVSFVFRSMSVAEIDAFSRSPYNLVVDTRMLLLFANPSATFLVILMVLVVGSMLIPSFWCRGFCPYGALLGIVACLSPSAVRRDPSLCVGCQACSRACPSRIPVHAKHRISGPECIGCTECVGACPQNGSLSVRFGFLPQAPVIPVWTIALGSVAVVAVLFTWAVATGHWSADLPQAMVRMLHSRIGAFSHP